MQITLHVPRGTMRPRLLLVAFQRMFHGEHLALLVSIFQKAEQAT